MELISYYASFYENSKCDELDKLLASNDWKKVTQGALILKSLLFLAKKLDTKSMPKTLEVTDTIETVAISFESKILQGFNEAYRKNDFDHLNHLAWILDKYNNGVNVIKNFIDKHDYFANADTFIPQKSAIFTDDNFKASLINPDAHSSKVDAAVVDHIKTIFAEIRNESEVVARVFESKTSHVMILFIQKVFLEKLRPLMTFLLNSSLSLSSLAYVRSLHTYFSVLNSSVKELSEFLSTGGLDNDGRLTVCLEKSLKSLFGDILFDRSKYFEVEKRTLEGVLAQKIADFNMLNDRYVRPKNLSNKLNEVTDFSSTPELKILTTQSTSKFSQLNLFLKNKLEKRMDHEYQDHLPVTINKDGEASFTLPHIDSMLKCSVESLARVMELVPGNAGEFSYELVEVSLIGVIDSYVESALEVAYGNLSNIDVHRDPRIDISFLKYVSKSTEMISIISTYIKSVVLPLLQNSPSIKRKVISLANAYFKRCELLINLLIEETVKLFTQKFIHILSKQKRKDFLSKSQDFLDQDTETTTELVSILNQMYAQSVLHLKNDNIKAFLAKVGDSLFDQLLNHYKKFQVSSTGGVIVTKDIIAYQTAVEEWGIPDLTEKFATLRELSNLFTVQPELLKSLTKEGRLVNVDRAIIDEYISKREDYNQDGFINRFKVTLSN